MSMFTAQETPQRPPDVSGLALQIDELWAMSLPQLAECYLGAFGVHSIIGSRHYLVRRIAWKWQSGALGGLSDSARAQAAEIAREIRFGDKETLTSETRAISSRKRNPRLGDKRQPEAGSELTRIYKDRRIVAKVNSEGYEYDRKQYSSLNAVARSR
jgi:hypothetical protein